MTLAKVLIYLPVHNGMDRTPEGEAKLRRQLDSILAQTFTDFSLLVIDNASDDETPEVVAEYAARDGRIQAHRNHKDLGFFSSLLLGMVSGLRHEYLIYASHNDYWHPEYLEECVRALDAAPAAALAYSHCQLIDLKTGRTGLYKDDVDLTGPDPGQRFVALLAGLGLCTAFYGLMRSSLVAENLRYLSWETAAGDNFLLACLSYAGSFLQIPRVLFFREMAADKQGENFEQRLGRLQALEAQPVSTRWPNVSVFVAHVVSHCRFLAYQTAFYYPDGQPAEVGPDWQRIREHLITQTVRILKTRYQGLIEEEETLGLSALAPVISQWQGGSPVVLSVALLATEQTQAAQRWVGAFVPGFHYGRALRALAQGRPREALLAVGEELAANPTHRQSLELKNQLEARVTP